MEEYWVIQFAGQMTFYDGSRYADSKLLNAKRYETKALAENAAPFVSAKFVDAETVVRKVEVVLVDKCAEEI